MVVALGVGAILMTVAAAVSAVSPWPAAVEPILWGLGGWLASGGMFGLARGFRRAYQTPATGPDLDLDVDGGIVRLDGARRERVEKAGGVPGAEALLGAPITEPVRVSRDRMTLVVVPERFPTGVFVAVSASTAFGFALAGTSMGRWGALLAVTLVQLFWTSAEELLRGPSVAYVRNGRMWARRLERDPAALRVVRDGVRFGPRGPVMRTPQPMRLMYELDQALAESHQGDDTWVDFPADPARGFGTHARIPLTTLVPDRQFGCAMALALAPLAGTVVFLGRAFGLTGILALAAGVVVSWWVDRLVRAHAFRARQIDASEQGVFVEGAVAPWSLVRGVEVELAPVRLRVDLHEGAITSHTGVEAGWRAWHAAALLAAREGRPLGAIERVPASDGDLVVWARREWEERTVRFVFVALAAILLCGIATGLPGSRLGGLAVVIVCMGLLVLPLAALVARARSEHLLVQGRFATLARGGTEIRFAHEDVVAVMPDRRRLRLELADGRRLRIPCDAPEQLARVLAEVGIHPHAVELPAEAGRVKRLAETA